jgi:hypothetical protein
MPPRPHINEEEHEVTPLYAEPVHSSPITSLRSSFSKGMKYAPPLREKHEADVHKPALYADMDKIAHP